MQSRRKLFPAIFFLLTLFLPITTFASKQPKTYPEEGKIVAVGLNTYSVGASKLYTHTYTVLTGTKRYILDCDKKPFLGKTGAECGGDKKLQIGDVIHFRVEKSSAYIPIAETLSPIEPPKQSEQKLKILSEELRPEAADVPASTPEKSETKTPNQ